MLTSSIKRVLSVFQHCNGKFTHLLRSNTKCIAIPKIYFFLFAGSFKLSLFRSFFLQCLLEQIVLILLDGKILFIFNVILKDAVYTNLGFVSHITKEKPFWWVEKISPQFISRNWHNQKSFTNFLPQSPHKKNSKGRKYESTYQRKNATLRCPSSVFPMIFFFHP